MKLQKHWLLSVVSLGFVACQDLNPQTNVQVSEEVYGACPKLGERRLVTCIDATAAVEKWQELYETTADWREAGKSDQICEKNPHSLPMNEKANKARVRITADGKAFTPTIGEECKGIETLDIEKVFRLISHQGVRKARRNLLTQLGPPAPKIQSCLPEQLAQRIP
jgi:hypothetical protein